MSFLSPNKFLLNNLRNILTKNYLQCVWNQTQFNFCRKLSSVKVEENNVIDNIFPDIEGLPQSLPKNYFKKSYDKKRNRSNNISSSSKESTSQSGHVVIDCKHKELNHYANQKYDKFSKLPLASKGWFKKQSRGDYFKINIVPEEKKQEVFWFDGIDSFENIGLDDKIIKAINNLGFKKPTYIQAFGIPEVLNNQNTLLAGETGCGKTLAYLLPIVQEILQWRKVGPDRKLNTPLALILVPGRELAHQIADVADRLAKELLFDINVVIGGHTKRLMTHPNFMPIDLFVSTIGAASKLTTSGIYNMSFVRHLVLDEADTVLDDSFNDAIIRYLRKFPLSYGKHPEDDQNNFPRFCKLTLASATMPTSIASILGNIIVPESLVKVETPRLHQVMVHVPQVFWRLGQSEKPAKLLELTKKNAKKEKPTIIFSNRAKVSDWISLFLNENGVSCVNLNGEMKSDIRAGRFDQFQRGFVDVISCTDMASRGLDTIRAKHVINYDFPIYMADYIHRCGRVGRVGHIDDCLVTNFVACSTEIELVQKIETAVRTMSVLPNVNANISRIIHHKMLKSDLNLT